jgi:hypothetical protein
MDNSKGLDELKGKNINLLNTEQDIQVQHQNKVYNTLI